MTHFIRITHEDSQGSKEENFISVDKINLIYATRRGGAWIDLGYRKILADESPEDILAMIEAAEEE